jgi:hypothetical protein
MMIIMMMLKQNQTISQMIRNSVRNDNKKIILMNQW